MFSGPFLIPQPNLQNLKSTGAATNPAIEESKVLAMIRRITLITACALVLEVSSMAQQKPPVPPPANEPGSVPQQEADTATPHQSARAFEGEIAKSGDQFVLEDRAAQTVYRLDDQQKAKKYLGKNVKVMATKDAHSRLLHVIDIVVPSSEER